MIKTPFFPMRPTTGPKLVTANVLAVVGEYRSRGYIIQPKWNGSRVILERTLNDVLLWNRQGKPFTQFAILPGPWKSLAAGTLLDGEAKDGRFRPFDCLRIGNRDIAAESTAYRVGVTQTICDQAGIDWIFGEPDNAWLVTQAMLKANPLTREWEGVVAKAALAPYRAMGSADQECGTWVKTKWA